MINVLYKELEKVSNHNNLNIIIVKKINYL